MCRTRCRSPRPSRGGGGGACSCTTSPVSRPSRPSSGRPWASSWGPREGGAKVSCGSPGRLACRWAAWGLTGCGARRPASWRWRGRSPRLRIGSNTRGEVVVSEADCIFCKIARGELDAEVVHDEDDVLAFEDINGKAPMHILVIPRQHVANLEEIGALPDSVVKRMFEVASAVAEKLGVTEGGYAVRINNGRDAGQEVFHFHLHVMGGKKLGMP